jgi:MFS family permease
MLIHVCRVSLCPLCSSPLVSGGYIVDKWSFHQRCTLLLPVSGLALLTLLIPSCHSLFELILVIGLQGFCSGMIDNVCQVLCIRFKTADGVSVSPYLQGLHFFFALGAVIAPFICQSHARSR